MTIKFAPRALSSVDDQGNRSVLAGNTCLTLGGAQPGETQAKSEAGFAVEGTTASSEIVSNHLNETRADLAICPRFYFSGYTDSGTCCFPPVTWVTCWNLSAESFSCACVLCFQDSWSGGQAGLSRDGFVSHVQDHRSPVRWSQYQAVHH